MKLNDYQEQAAKTIVHTRVGVQPIRSSYLSTRARWRSWNIMKRI